MVHAAHRAIGAMVAFEELAIRCDDPAHVMSDQCGAETIATIGEAATTMAAGIRHLLFQCGFVKPTGATGTGMTIEGCPFKA